LPPVPADHLLNPHAFSISKVPKNTSHWCSHCGEDHISGSKVHKCDGCGATAHVDCSKHLPDLCGLDPESKEAIISSSIRQYSNKQEQLRLKAEKEEEERWKEKGHTEFTQQVGAISITAGNFIELLHFDIVMDPFSFVV
jgi:hypothetical protein